MTGGELVTTKQNKKVNLTLQPVYKKSQQKTVLLIPNNALVTHNEFVTTGINYYPRQTLSQQTSTLVTTSCELDTKKHNKLITTFL